MPAQRRRSPAASRPARRSAPPPASARALPEPSGLDLARRWSRLRAVDVMRTHVVTVETTTSLGEAQRTLADAGVSGAPVTDGHGRFVGVVTLRDLVERYADEPEARARRGPGWFYLSSDETLEEDLRSLEPPEGTEETVSDVMTGEVYAVPLDADLRRIAQTMSRHRIHRVFVTADGRAVVGVVSALDVLEALAK